MSWERIVAVTGTRFGCTPVQRERAHGLLWWLGPSILLHGGCTGVDRELSELVSRFKPRPEIHRYPGVSAQGSTAEFETAPDPWDDVVHGEQTHMARNRTLVSRAHVVVACPREAEWQERGGTWYTAGQARKMHKRLYVVGPDGTLKWYPPPLVTV